MSTAADSFCKHFGSVRPSTVRARENLFRVECLELIDYRISAADWEMLLQKVEQYQYRGALIGAHGSGKSTLLKKITRYLKESDLPVVHLRLSLEKRSFDDNDLDLIKGAGVSSQIFTLDGAEQLSLMAWRLFLWQARKFKGLIITTHSPGRLPTLWRCQTSSALLEELIIDLWPDCPEINAVAERYFQRHQGNLREALRELYDRFPDP